MGIKKKSPRKERPFRDKWLLIFFELLFHRARQILRSVLLVLLETLGVLSGTNLLCLGTTGRAGRNKLCCSNLKQIFFFWVHVHVPAAVDGMRAEAVNSRSAHKKRVLLRSEIIFHKLSTPRAPRRQEAKASWHERGEDKIVTAGRFRLQIVLPFLKPRTFRLACLVFRFRCAACLACRCLRFKGETKHTESPLGVAVSSLAAAATYRCHWQCAEIKDTMGERPWLWGKMSRVW